jgi:putative spermidine/putrescine transport system ATP-binding protein
VKLVAQTSTDEPSASPKGSLTLDHVSKLYGELRAVDDISLEVAPGEFVTLLGPSGSGKTTTLRIIGGFIQPDAGTVMLDGRDLTRVPPYKRDIGMVFQNYALFPHMTALENVAFPLAMRRVGKAEAKRRALEALGLVRLEHLGDRYPKQLSGGQQQRVALARSFSFSPQLLLMDEPLGALDRKLREALQLEVLRISRQLAVTVVYVTHDQEESLVMSDRIAIYNEGRIEQIGSGADLYEHPTSLFVADFVGESNIYRGTLCADPTPCIMREQGPPLPVSPTAGTRVGLSAGERAAVVVRPERMSIRQGGTLHAEAGDDEVVRLSGRLRELIYLGSDRKYVVDVEGGSTAVVRVQAGTEGVEEVVGPDVTVSWQIDESVVVTDFDSRATTGAAVVAGAKP